MTQAIDINTSLWTEKHEAYCYKHHIPPISKTLWQWLLRQGEPATDIEPDLAEFNNWVEKHRGKPYCHNYLKKALNVLIESRVIQVTKQYSWKVFKLLVRPLEWLKPPRKPREKNLQNNNLSYNSQPSNDSSAVVSTNQQQHSTSTQNMVALAEEGITFDEKEKEVLDRPLNEIRLSILLFKKRGGIEKIQNPEGWIRSCLRDRYWEQTRNYNTLLLEYGNSTEWEELFPVNSV